MVDKQQKNIAATTSEQIQSYEGPEAIRLRPGMYIGGTDLTALHHLVYEVVDNSIDEAMAGRCDYIEVVIHSDNSVTISDNGGGIPVDKHAKLGIPTLEAVMTRLHTGAKFGSGAYQVSGGLHGVGVKAVNALSAQLIAEVYRDGRVWRQTYEEGRPTSGVVAVRKLKPGEPTGTRISFMPDTTIFPDINFDFERLENRFREMAYVVRGVTLRLVDQRVEPFPREVTFYFEGGISSFIRYLNHNRDPLHGVVYGSGQTEFTYNFGGEERDGVIEVEFALQYTDSTNSTEIAFANTINTPDGGTHLTGLRTAITRVLNNYARKAGFLKEKDANFTGRHTLDGLTAIVSIRHPNPQFESQTKVKLMNPEVSAAVSGVVSEAFTEYLEQNPREAKRIIDKCLTTQRIQDALDKQRELLLGERKNFLSNTTLPGKLADCSDKGEHTEIYIVEGDSAGGCFSGDTQIALADGRNITFEELVQEQAQGREHFGYTIRKDGTIGLERLVNARITKQNAEVIRLTLDNGETIICTPDHRFMLRDGSYKAAEALAPDDSLMPLYRKVSARNQPGVTIDGYEMTWDSRSETWIFTHLLADRYNRWKGIYIEASGDHCHHIDFNKRNNNPTNFSEHPEARQQAAEKAKIQWQDSELLEWRREQTRKQWTPEFRAARKEALHNTYYRKTLAALKRIELQQGSVNLEAYAALRRETGDRSLLRFDTFCKRYFDGNSKKALEAVANFNHRIISIERIEERLDVYDVEVPHTHNFALACGVFVHNSAKQARDRHFQAILPIRGKILNTERATLNKILDSTEIKALISALGIGIREDSNIDKMRYGRCIIMTDADVDGAHIRTLLLTFFYRYMTPVITNGRLFIAQPPIFRLEYKKQVEYVYPASNLKEDQLLAQMLAKYPEPDKVGVQRYKGLGEMNPEQLWETTMNPEKRTILQVTMEDAAAADLTFDMLMGPAVPPRRKFIMTHSKDARLDI